jgi:CarboxypepD_reg-like domain
MRVMTRNRFDESPSFRLQWSSVSRMRSSAFVLAAMTLLMLVGIVGDACFVNNARAQSGKISAKIIDAKTGEPLLRASVQILQTKAGAYTKENGVATIIGVPPEEDYTVVAKYTGYNPDTIFHVRIQSDITTSLNYKLSIKGGIVVNVTAQLPMVEKTQTDIATKFDQTELATMPGRQRLDEVILLTPGAVQDNANGGISFHGSRGSDNSFRLNGVEVTDPLTGQASALQYGISRLAISEVDIVTGSADASKGGFTGGEVNTQTRAGGNDLDLTAHYRTEIPSLFGSANGIKQMPSGDDIYEMAIGGPLFDQSVKFYLTGRLNSFQYYNVFDNPTYMNDGLGVIDPEGNNLGELPNTERYRRAATGKLSFDAFGFNVQANTTLSAESDLLNSWGTGTGTSYEPSYYVPAEEQTNNVYSLTARGQIGDGVLELTGGYTISDIQIGLYDQTQPVDAFHEPQFLSTADNYTVNADNTITQKPDGIIDIYTPVLKQIPDPANPTQPYASQVPGLNPFTGHIEGPAIAQSSANAYGIVGLFPVVGNVGGFVTENTDQTQFSGNYSIQIGSHFLSAGFESNIMSVYKYEDDLPWDANPFKDSFLVHPYTGAVYFTDKMEFSDITFAPGIRYDLYQPDANSIPNLYNPVAAGTSLVPTKVQSQISPRLAITYAVTDQTTFNFGYNWYFKQPDLNDVLQNTAGGNLAELTQALQRGNQILGSANLQADQTKEVDVGFHTQLSDIFAFSVTGIYKDLRNQDGLENIVSPLLPIGYTIYSSDQYGSDRSIELVAEKRMSDNFSMKLNYTYGEAVGTSSSATENYAALINQDPSSPDAVLPLTPFPFSYDRTNVLNFLFDLNYNKGEGPTIFGEKLFEWFYETGVPYTALDVKGAQIGPTNGDREPDYFQTDVSLTRTIPFGDIFGPSMSRLFLDLQIEVTNVFNRTTPLDVYPATGQGSNNGLPNTFSTSTEYYNDPTNTRGGQIDALGNLYYNPRLDLNHDGRVSVAEQEIAYGQYVSDNYARETNYQTPRRVWMNFTLRF